MNITEKGSKAIPLSDLPRHSCFVFNNELYAIVSSLDNIEKYDYAYEVACFNFKGSKVEILDSDTEVVVVEVDVIFKRE